MGRITKRFQQRLAYCVIFQCVFVLQQIGASEAQTIKPENWKGCAVRPLTTETDWDSWNSIPLWARAPHLVRIYEEPRMLLNHGLCNNTFKRIVLCLPAWDEEGADKKDPFHRVCAAVFRKRRRTH